MEFMTGVKEKETLELSELLEEGRLGEEVKVNGAVHTIRDMGTVAFVILRKREGLVQCVYEEGVTKFNLKDLREAATVEVTGKLTESEKAPNGIEIRLSEIKVLSMPKDSLPLAVSKWKLNTSLEAKLNYRSISLRNVRERAKFKIQEGIVRGFREFLYKKVLQKFIPRRSEQKEQKEDLTSSDWIISIVRQCWNRVHSCTNR